MGFSGWLPISLYIRVFDTLGYCLRVFQCLHIRWGCMWFQSYIISSCSGVLKVRGHVLFTLYPLYLLALWMSAVVGIYLGIWILPKERPGECVSAVAIHTRSSFSTQKWVICDCLIYLWISCSLKHIFSGSRNITLNF